MTQHKKYKVWCKIKCSEGTFKPGDTLDEKTYQKLGAAQDRCILNPKYKPELEEAETPEKEEKASEKEEKKETETPEKETKKVSFKK